MWTKLFVLAVLLACGNLGVPLLPRFKKDPSSPCRWEEIHRRVDYLFMRVLIELSIPHHASPAYSTDSCSRCDGEVWL